MTQNTNHVLPRCPDIQDTNHVLPRCPDTQDTNHMPPRCSDTQDINHMLPRCPDTQDTNHVPPRYGLMGKSKSYPTEQQSWELPEAPAAAAIASGLERRAIRAAQTAQEPAGEGPSSLLGVPGSQLTTPHGRLCFSPSSLSGRVNPQVSIAGAVWSWSWISVFLFFSFFIFFKV